MEKYKIEQYNNEINYINKTIFDNIKIKTKLKKIENRSVYQCNILFYNKDYILYKYDKNNILLIPNKENVFEEDFDDIYELCYDKRYGICLFQMRKKESKIEIYNNNFILKRPSLKLNYISCSLNYKSMQDNENKLYKLFKNTKEAPDLFILKKSFNKIYKSKEQMIINIRRYENNNCQKYEKDSFVEAFKDIIYKDVEYQNIKINNNKSLIETTREELDNKKLIKKN